MDQSDAGHTARCRPAAPANACAPCIPTLPPAHGSVVRICPLNPASGWSIMRIYPHALHPIGPIFFQDRKRFEVSPQAGVAQ
eukprot:3400848-Pyramimonas_sp.AAC.1